MSAVVTTIVRTMWRALAAGSAAPGRGDVRQVRLLVDAPQSPMTPEECLIARVLADNEPRTVDEIIISISRELYQQEWRRGGWAVDLGTFGPNLFTADITHALEAGNGHLWTLWPREH